MKSGGCSGFLEECFAARVESVKQLRGKLGAEAEALHTDRRTDVSAFDSLGCHSQGVPKKGRWSLQAPLFLLYKSRDGNTYGREWRERQESGSW